MDVHTAQVQAAVQQLVMEHGEYAPLELLLATNRLGYVDYRAWREGRLETLDAVLADGRREICTWLEPIRATLWILTELDCGQRPWCRTGRRHCRLAGAGGVRSRR